MPRAKKNEVAKTDTGALATIDLDNDLLNEALGHTEEVSADDVAVPRIGIAQALSEVCKKSSSDYNADVEVGDFYDKASGQIWTGEEGLVVLPVHYRRTYIEWDKKRNFIADHGSDCHDLIGQIDYDAGQGKPQIDNGNLLVQTAEYAVFIVNLETGEYTPAMMNMSGAQFKKSKQWMAKITQLIIDTPNGRSKAPMFYKTYTLTTKHESNDEGEWYGYVINGAKLVTEIPNGGDLFKAALDFRKQMEAGEVKVAQYDSEGAVEDEDEPM